MSPNAEYSEFWESHTIAKNGILKDIYSKFDDTCSSDNNQDFCAIEHGKYEDHNDVKKLYYKLNGNKTKYELGNEEFATYFKYPLKFCNYLKYWLYDKIVLNNFDKDNITEILKAVKNKDNFQIIMGTSDTCNFDIFELEKIKGIKLFYDYIGNYDMVQKKSSINDEICKSNYKTTLNNIIGLYNDANSNGEKKSNEYSNELDECKKIYNIDTLCKLQCNDKGSHSTDETESECSQVFLLPQHSSNHNSDGGELHNGQDLGHSENQFIGISMTGISILVSLFVIFPILYKLTPFGPWLHKSIMKTKNFLHNPKEISSNILLNHISESENENFIRRPQYIAYHSS
ncbi:PIR Superfamily Protein [Plasmodium ovale wallikeri]|uniref:PIR Superfamily Protein n=1 Tax=Plasmodium ovale wallikeri TaxID=864142 RepID=A0A1A9AHM3_PLAOA|nr:PIR Superfamily Protein [Plasmodium ovale wallikeri]